MKPQDFTRNVLASPTELGVAISSIFMMGIASLSLAMTLSVLSVVKKYLVWR